MRKPFSAETRAKMSAWQKGKPKSAAHRAAMSAAQRGKKKTPEHCAAISKGKTGIPRGAHTEESKRKISASCKKAWARKAAMRKGVGK